MGNGEALRGEGFKRTRDVGSGLSFELLDEDILKFIFNGMVRGKILKDFSGIIDQIGRSTESRNIYWDVNHGCASKEDTDELIFIGASLSDQLRIRNILKEDGGFSAISTLSSDSQALDDVTKKNSFQAVISILHNTLVKIGPLMKICTANAYTVGNYNIFKEDHVDAGDGSPSRKRLIAYYTKDTKQGKMIVDSYLTGAVASRKGGSHPAMIRKKTLEAFLEEQDGRFSESKQYINAHYYG